MTDRTTIPLFQCRACNRFIEDGRHLPAHVTGNEMREVFIPAMRAWLEEDALLAGARTMSDADVLEAVHYEYYGGIAAFVSGEADHRYLASTTRRPN